MAKVYLTFDTPSVDENYIYIWATARVMGIPGFSELAVTMPFANEPSANTIISTVRAYALAEIEAATGISIPPGQVVIFGGPS